MRLHKIIALTATLVISSAFSAAAQKSVKVDMKDGMGNSVGTAELSPAPKGVSIKLNLMNLPPGMHGIHVHAVAKCEGPDFIRAGGHLNRNRNLRGRDNPAGLPAGDMPNVPGAADGTAKATIVA